MAARWKSTEPVGDLDKCFIRVHPGGPGVGGCPRAVSPPDRTAGVPTLQFLLSHGSILTAEDVPQADR